MCTCDGKERAFQPSDGSCICKAGMMSIIVTVIKYTCSVSLSVWLYLSTLSLTFILFLGYVYYNTADLEDSDGNSNLDCQPIVDDRCSLGQVRLASSRTCVDPATYDCTAACGSAGGELDPNLGK